MICTCSKRNGISYDTVHGHALDCARALYPETNDHPVLERTSFEAVEVTSVEKPNGLKYDQGKSRVDLLIDGCPNAIKAVSDVLTFGAKKYDDHSWQCVENGISRYKAAMLRHIIAHSSGELIDSESGLSHLAHAACNALFILELELKKDA